MSTGGRYNSDTDVWTATSATNAPTGRFEHTAVWTGAEMIVWGGFTKFQWLNTGARYDPLANSWTATTTINAPAGRFFHAAVWNGSEMTVWGGYDGTSSLNTGGRYDPGTNGWTGTSAINAPVARFGHTAVWTGNEMIIWGGTDNFNATYFNTGGRYNPGADSWIATSTTNSPLIRAYHTATWTGSEMIVWGGYKGSYLNTGGGILRCCIESYTHAYHNTTSYTNSAVSPYPSTAPVKMVISDC